MQTLQKLHRGCCFSNPGRNVNGILSEKSGKKKTKTECLCHFKYSLHTGVLTKQCGTYKLRDSIPKGASF